jgi:hypothetical protein
MSVDIVPLQHIQVLVHSALEGVAGSHPGHGPLEWHSLPYSQLDGVPVLELHEFLRRATYERADVIGQMLMDENVVSYGHRYPEATLDCYPIWSRVPYAHRRLDFQLTPVECLKAVEGYVYQACEHGGWWDSEAAQFCDALRLHAIQALEGWREAPFLYDHILVGARTVRSRSQALAANTKG